MPLQQNCRNCGAPVELGRLDCAHCGTAFEKVSSTPEPGAKPKSAPAEDKKGEVQREERTQDQQPAIEGHLEPMEEPNEVERR